MTATVIPDFRGYSALLRREDSGVPRLVIDLATLDANIERLRRCRKPSQIRLVAKSLPAIGLLRHVMESLGTHRLMVFHLPFLLQIFRAFPGADILMGKPLPEAALRRFHETTGSTADVRRVQWLADTPERVATLAGVARALGQRLRVSAELDVGMHRGGAAGHGEVAALLEAVRAHRKHVELAGFMGYDAHVPKSPWPGGLQRARDRALARYRNAVEFARAGYGELEEQEWCLNGAGSPTLTLHDDSSPANDYSIGSALLKPADFDLPTLADFRPACWIAAPILKRLPGVRIPFLEWLPSRGRDSLFLYGGRWMAAPVFPPGLAESRLYGLSSNQQLMTVPGDSDLRIGDYVFFRPTQSEAVLLQFGDLIAVADERIAARWPVLDGETPARR